MDHFLDDDSFRAGYNLYSTTVNHSDPITHTQKPVVVGATVLGIKYQDGVMLASDTLASYGSFSRYRNEDRLCAIGESTVIGVSGDMSDFYHIKNLLESLMTKEYYINDGHVLSAAHIYEYLGRVMYHRRTKLNPLWNTLVVGGYNEGKKFLGYVDLYGQTYEAPIVATGLGAFYTQPILRKAVEGREDPLTEAEAIEVLNTCLRILFYRECRTVNRMKRAKVTADGVEITDAYSLSTEWAFAESLRGFATQVK
jgi:20S proteasome subunit beta 7